MGDRGCNLECVKQDKEENRIEFVGPVKIILVDQSKASYICKTCYAAVIVLAQMMMGITTIIVMFFSLSYKKSACLTALHIFLCTVGLQVIIPSGVLNLNNLNGSAAPMKISDRRSEHVFMQFIGLGCTIVGTIISFLSGFSNKSTLHSGLGIAATILTILCAMTGLFFYEFRGETKSPDEYSNFRCFIYRIHQVFGTLSISVSSVCFICGIIKTPFINWLPLNEMYYYMIIFCIFYTIVILYKPLKQFL